MIKQLNFSNHQRTFTPDNLKIRKEFGSLITNPEEETKDDNKIGFRNQYITEIRNEDVWNVFKTPEDFESRSNNNNYSWNKSKLKLTSIV